jgi:hypothetical protein
MNEAETKIAEAIKTLDRILLPMAYDQEEKHTIENVLDHLRSSFISAVGRRVIKGNN